MKLRSIKEAIPGGRLDQSVQIRLSNKNSSLISNKQSLKIALLTFIIAMVVDVDARKTFFVKQQHPALYAPKVKAYDTSIILFDIQNGKERYHGAVDNQIQTEAGFDFIQKSGYFSMGTTTTTQRHWAFRNNLYFRNDFVLHPEMILDKIYKGEIFVEVPKFRTNVFWELLWFPVEDKMCIQLGWNSDPIYFLIRSGFNVLECYKNIIYTLTDWSQWDSQKMSQKGSIWDVCQSSITSNAQVYRLSLYTNSANKDNYFIPEVTFDSSTPAVYQTGACWNVPNLG